MNIRYFSLKPLDVYGSLDGRFKGVVMKVTLVYM